MPKDGTRADAGQLQYPLSHKFVHNLWDHVSISVIPNMPGRNWSIQEDIILLQCKLDGLQDKECQKCLRSELSSDRTMASIRSRLATLRGHHQNIYDSREQKWQSGPLQDAMQELLDFASEITANGDSNTAST